ncbi:MAG TPA: serine hydrolase, partial [Candidatus Eisenbacteria bacterium]|nr:serine hydrolase [Candidatus Eisenbacteria bacterium]
MQRMSPVAVALAFALAAAPARSDTTPGPSPRLAVPALAAPAPAMTDAQLVAAVHALVDSLTAAGEFSGVVLLAHGDRTLVREARGLADRERGLRNQPNTVFNLGSINKKLTEVAIRQLAAQGRLAFTDTIARYLPDYPADKGRRITIQQLLDHRAGTGDIFNDRFRATDPARLRTLADWMDLIRDQPLEFEPGTRQAYSNAGYVLLGAIVERVTGESYFDYVQAHVYAPAGMAASGSFARDEASPNRAIGYTRRDAPGGALQPNTVGLPGRGSSAGGGYSTVDDLRRLVAALRAGRLGIAPDSSDFLIAGGSPGVNAALGAVGGYTLVVLANLDPPAAVGLASRLEHWLPRRGGGGARVEVGGEGDRRGRPGITLVPPGGTSVAMDTSHPLPTLMVMVNGQGPFRFGLDTGGAGSARVDSALAARLGLRTVGAVRAGDPSGRGLVTLPLVAVDSIRVG